MASLTPGPSKPLKKASSPFFVPLLAALVLAPILTFSVGQFILLPQLKKQLDAPAAAPGIVTVPQSSRQTDGSQRKHEGKSNSDFGYKFESIVVNLSGSMGTRHLRTTVFATGSDPTLVQQFEQARPQLLDITLGLLSSLSLADLEKAGSKELIRQRLAAAYNDALGRPLVEKIYFSEFVVR